METNSICPKCKIIIREINSSEGNYYLCPECGEITPINSK